MSKNDLITKCKDLDIKHTSDMSNSKLKALIKAHTQKTEDTAEKKTDTDTDENTDITQTAQNIDEMSAEELNEYYEQIQKALASKIVKEAQTDTEKVFARVSNNVEQILSALKRFKDTDLKALSILALNNKAEQEEVERTAKAFNYAYSRFRKFADKNTKITINATHSNTKLIKIEDIADIKKHLA